MRLILEGIKRLPTVRRGILMLSVLSILTAQIESTALVLVGLTIQGFADGSGRMNVDVGPLSANVGIYQAVALAFALLLVGAALTAAFLRLQIRLAARLEREYRDRLAHSFAAADWEFQATLRAGRLNGLSRWTSMAPRLFSGVTFSIRAGTMVIFFLFVAFTINWPAALTASVLGAVLGGLMIPLRRRVRAAAQRHANAELKYSEELSEAMELAPDLRVFRGWPNVTGQLDRTSGVIEAARRTFETITTAVPMTYQYGGPVVVVAVVFFLSVSSAAVNLGSLAAVGFLLLRVIQFGQVLQSSQQMILQAITIVDSLVDELDALDASRTPRGSSAPGTIREIELLDVSYSYPKSPREALRGITLTLRSGEVLGMVGPSGGGKSTLGQILLGLRFPSAGRVLINGIDAVQVSDEHWFGRVAHVPQQPHLLHGTLADNVTMFDSDIPRERIDQVVSEVGLAELVAGLPHGLDTEVGPATRALSGGQLQRLAIARALVRQPDVIVLDEPTSALDVDSENVVQEALAGLKDGSDLIIVVIAHRVSTLAMCDRILVLSEGGMVADGSPDSVADESTFFSRALQSQLSGVGA